MKPVFRLLAPDVVPRHPQFSTTFLKADDLRARAIDLAQIYRKGAITSTSARQRSRRIAEEVVCDIKYHGGRQIIYIEVDRDIPCFICAEVAAYFICLCRPSYGNTAPTVDLSTIPWGCCAHCHEQMRCASIANRFDDLPNAPISTFDMRQCEYIDLRKPQSGRTGSVRTNYRSAIDPKIVSLIEQEFEIPDRHLGHSYGQIQATREQPTRGAHSRGGWNER